MTETVSSSSLSGTVAAPPSKSHLQRAIAIASLAEGESMITGYVSSEDVDAAIAAARALGAIVKVDGTTLTISKGAMPASSVQIYCGESGLSARMSAAIASLSDVEVTLTGSGTLPHRPFEIVGQVLSQLGKTVKLQKGRLPLTLSGTLTSGVVYMDGSETSQLLTGLLIALPLLPGRSTIHVKGLNSRPYIELTIETLATFGIAIENHEFTTFSIQGGQRPSATCMRAEGDWSAAAFLLVGGAVAGNVSVSGLNPHSAQADRAILDALHSAGAQVSWANDVLTVAAAPLRSFHFDATQCPDLFPPLAALAACCLGTSTIVGCSRLSSKESDRTSTIKSVLYVLGIDVKVEKNSMHIKGGAIAGGTVSSFHDHRIAMMATLLGCVADGPVSITEAEAVNKSYPVFFNDIASLRQ
jgi:3-phosphoshikimate 1-carboxyvinyltransferase